MISAQDLRPVTPSSNPFIQALLNDTSFQPGAEFVYVLQGETGDTGAQGGAVWAAHGRGAAFAASLETWSNVANISFVQHTGAFDGTGSTSAFDFIESFEDLGESILGQHELPHAGTLSGNFNSGIDAFLGANASVGGLGFATFVHEIGHGLGLLHPHGEGIGGPWDVAFPGVNDPFHTGSFGLNQGPFTVMTYNSGYAEVGTPFDLSFGWEAGPGAFDIAAIQYIYGANTTHNTGNQSYSLATENVAGTGWSTIWDAGGVDEISAAGQDVSAYINLHAATLLLEEGGGGFVSRIEGVLGGYTIANGVLIDNAIGGNGDDVLIGNIGNNTLNGGLGVDTIDLSYLDFGITVDLSSGTVSAEGVDTLVSIEGVRTGDGNDILTASNSADSILLTDLFIRDSDFIGGDATTTAIDLNPYFDLRATSHVTAPMASANHLVATVEAVGRRSIDHYSFTLGADAAGSQIILDIDDTFALDTIIKLLDAQGNVLATSDDIGTNLDLGSAAFTDSMITYNLPGNFSGDQVFHIEVAAYSAAGGSFVPTTGSYTLHLVAIAAQGSSGDVHGVLDGGEGDDTFYDGAGNDLLVGGRGNDVFFSSAGADRLEGGLGDDTYHIAGLGSIIAEQQHVNGGTDAVFASIDYALQSEFVENLTLVQGSLAVSGTGNAARNIITGNDYANRLLGLGNNDVLYGGAGNDILEGGDGQDELHAGEGTDYLYGGASHDEYFLSSANDLVFEDVSGGIDRINIDADFYLTVNVEILTLEGSDGHYGVGNSGDNSIEGNDGDNLLIGGLGSDKLKGNSGNDLLFGEDGADELIGNHGIDYLIGGAGDDDLTGSEGADALYGGDGNDILEADGSSLNAYSGASMRPRDPDFVTDILVGGAGNDTLYGASGLGDYDLLYGNSGDDTFYVDTPDDLTFEEAGEGHDTVYADIDGAGFYLYDNIEDLYLEGDTPFGVGNALDNVLTGANGKDNWLLGGAGNDTLNGGNYGNDVLFGEAGNDIFVFNQPFGSDIIGDFVIGEDNIDLQSAEIANFAQLQTLFVQNGENGAIIIGDNVVILHNVQMDQLSEADFIL